MPKPLSYGAFVDLTQALGSSDEDVAKGLPFSEQKSITIDDFSRLIYSMGKLAGKMALGPPVIKDNTFNHTVRAAVTYFTVHTPDMAETLRKQAFSRHISLVANNMSIHFCPWSGGFFPVTGSTSGRKVDRVVVATSWVTLGAPRVADMDLPESDLTLQEGICLKLQKVQRKIMKDDRRSDWSLTEVSNLCSVSHVVERQTLPSDWGLHLCSLPPDPDNLITRTYGVMNRLLDLSQPHISCIFWTSFIFIRAIPDIGHGAAVSLPRPGLTAGSPHIDPPGGFTEFYKRNVPWMICSGKANGKAQRLPYMVMFTLSFMAWLEESSPLHSHGVDLKPWHSKHRKPLFAFQLVYSDVFARAKFLTPLNFIRCGLADAIATEEGSQLHKGAKYGVNWRPKSKEELGHRAVVLTQAFKETAAEGGLYEILADIFSPPLARQICQRENCNYPLELTNDKNNPTSTPVTRDGRATALPPLLNISQPAPQRLRRPITYQGQSIMTPEVGIRAMEPNPTPRQRHVQIMTPRGIRAIEPYSSSKGPRFAKPSNLDSGSVRPQPDVVVTANTGLMSTSPRRFTAIEKGKRKESPTLFDNERGNRARRMV
jgi:hypothetical protein